MVIAAYVFCIFLEEMFSSIFGVSVVLSDFPHEYSSVFLVGVDVVAGCVFFVLFFQLFFG